MLYQNLGNLTSNRVYRVQTGHRLLKDHADLATPDRPHVFFAQLGQLPLSQMYRTLSDLTYSGW